MSVKISIEFDSPAAAAAFMQTIAGQVTAPTVTAKPASTKPAAAAPKKGAAKPETKPTAITEADVQVALDDVFKKRGMATSVALLGRYGVKKLRQLTPEQYEKFIAEAKDVAEGKDVEGAA